MKLQKVIAYILMYVYINKYNTFISLRQWHFVKSSSIIILSKQSSFPRDIPDRDKGRLEIDDSSGVKVYQLVTENGDHATTDYQIKNISNILLTYKAQTNQYHISSLFIF